MNIIVCVKHVPDIEDPMLVEKGAVTFLNNKPRMVINSLDLLAIEEAMRIKEGMKQGQVTLISLGASSSEESLRKGLAMGVEEAILLCDPGFDNSDGYATALALAKKISAIPHDLVLCGRRADDTQAGVVGAYLAQMLGLSLVQGVINVAVNDEGKTLTVHRKLERGTREVVACSLPALLTVEAGINTPRYLSVPGILKARKKAIAKYDSKELGLSSDEVGPSGSKSKVIRISPPKPKMKGLIIPDGKLSPAERLKMIAGGGLVPRKSNMLEGEPGKVASQLLQFFKQNRIL
jgi:electron transfer flavoprotein beta subunit